MATLRDVAERAGVSLATVSRVINEAGLVTDITRARVEKAMAELHYLPNLAARALVTGGRTAQLAIVVEDIRHPYYAECAAAFRVEAGRQGYATLFMETREQSLTEILALLRARQVEGIAIFRTVRFESGQPSRLLDEVRRLTATGVAVCVVGEAMPSTWELPDYGVSGVALDTFGGARAIAEHLVRLGHERIAFIGSNQALVPSKSQRYRAFCEVLTGRGLATDRAWTTTKAGVADTPLAGYIGARRVLRRDPAVTAFMAFNDVVAIGALKALHEAGRRVPVDASVTGFDNVSWARFAIPSLTTAALDRNAICRSALQLLLDKKGGGARRVVTIEGKLVEAESSASPHSPAAAEAQRKQRGMGL